MPYLSRDSFREKGLFELILYVQLSFHYAWIFLIEDTAWGAKPIRAVAGWLWFGAAPYAGDVEV